MKEKKQVIYCIEGPAGVYIGETENFDKRQQGHSQSLNYSLWLYGIEERPKITILTILPDSATKKVRLQMEEKWCEHFRQFKVVINDKIKAEKCKKLAGENNPFYGKKHDEESKKKIGNREYLSGEQHPWFGQHRFVGTDNPFYGKKHSEETKAKISKIAKRRFPKGPNYGKKCPWVGEANKKRKKT